MINFIIWIIVGAILGGWIANDLLDLGTGGGIIGSIILGVVGAVIILFALRKSGVASTGPR